MTFFYAENDVSNIQKDTSKILSLVSRNQYNGRSRSRTPSPSRRSDLSHVKKWDIIAINVQIKKPALCNRLSCLDCRTLLEYFTLVESFNFLVVPKPPDC
jgi:hypothetical protein